MNHYQNRKRTPYLGMLGFVSYNGKCPKYLVDLNAGNKNPHLDDQNTVSFRSDSPYMVIASATGNRHSGRR